MELTKIKAKHIVKPSEGTSNGILPLSELDQIGVITHTSLIYIYNKPTQHSLYPSYTKVIDALKDSLSRALVRFYPLAGRLRWLASGRLELECNDNGAELIEAESGHRINELGNLTSAFKAFKHLIPEVDYGKPMDEIPLLLVQVTRFECGGIGLSTAMSHVVTDGLGAAHFLQNWARLARGDPCGLHDGTPYVDRGVLIDYLISPSHQNKQQQSEEFPLPHHVEQADYFSRLPTLAGKEDDLEERGKEIVGTMLVLTKRQVDRLKKVANEESTQRDEDDEGKGWRPYSRFEVIAAHVWRCACKAREHKNDQMTGLCFCVDSRCRMDPPLPPRYFGNAIVDVVATSQANELMSRPLSHACRKIRQVITEKVTNDYIRSMIEFLKAQKSLSKYQDLAALGITTEGVFYGNPNIGVASWLNLPLRGLDFGWGSEIYMGPGCCEFDGDIMILPGHNEDGSVLVTVGFQVSYMEKFKDYFYEYVDELESGQEVLLV